MYQLFIEALIEIGIIVITLDLTALSATILTEIITLNNFYIAIRINIPNFKNLFRIEFIIRIVIEDSALDQREEAKEIILCRDVPQV